jgi:hypothetical protein
MVSAYCAVRAGPLNTADNIFIFNVLKVTQIGRNVQRNYKVTVFLIMYVSFEVLIAASLKNMCNLLGQNVL